MAELRGRLAGLGRQIKDHARKLDRYVRGNPWQAITRVAGAALPAGVLLGRRR